MKKNLFNFLIFCSGADREILKECPEFETQKFIGIGGTILFTGIFAFISSSYALTRVFHDGGTAGIFSSIFFGFLWGLLIFNLDRYIVSSLRKDGSALKQFWSAFPRFVMAILISLVIANPLEVKLFEDRIADQIKRNRQTALKSDQQFHNDYFGIERISGGITTTRNDQVYLDSMTGTEPNDFEYLELKQNFSSCQTELTQIQNRNNPKINNLNTKWREEHQAYNDYVKKIKRNLWILKDTTFSDIKKSLAESELPQQRESRDRHKQLRNNYGADINKFKNEISSVKGRCENLKGQVQNRRTEHSNKYKAQVAENTLNLQELMRNKRIADSLARVNIAKDTASIVKAFSPNFITQVEALGDLTSEFGSTMWWAGKLIMLLFLLVESAPILVKLLTKEGIYDERIKFLEDYESGKREDDLKTHLKLNEKNNEAMLTSEIEANETLLEKIAAAQHEIAEAMVEKWKHEEIDKIGKD